MKDSKTVVKKEKIRHENAVVINLSGHRISQSVFDQLKEEGHQYFHIFSEHINIDPDKDMFTQCHEITSNLISRPNSNNQSLLDVEGEKYYLSCGHAQANLIIYNALAAFLGYNPNMLVTGINRFKFQDYECKQLFNLQSWVGRWRSIERNKYLQQTSVHNRN